MANAHTTNELCDAHTLHETLHETEKAMQNAITTAPEHPISAENPADIATAARHLGLKPVRAWVPDNPAKPRSSSAERTRRSRQKAKEHGLEPLSVLLRVDLHEPVKALAARSRGEEPAAEIWADLSPKQDQAPIPPSLPKALAKPRGLRLWLLRRLLPSELRALID